MTGDHGCRVFTMKTSRNLARLSTESETILVICPALPDFGAGYLRSPAYVVRLSRVMSANLITPASARLLCIFTLSHRAISRVCKQHRREAILQSHEYCFVSMRVESLRVECMHDIAARCHLSKRPCMHALTLSISPEERDERHSLQARMQQQLYQCPWLKGAAIGRTPSRESQPVMAWHSA